MFSYLPHTDEIRESMLKDIGLEKIEDLFKQINPDIRIKDSEFNLAEGISEQEACKKISGMAAKNKNFENALSFLGGGVYNRYIPACISAIIQRSEFITSYTPYQPEVSQGTLQAIFDYQTLICNLTGMDVSNASVYDGASACAEAVLMASRLTRKTEILVSEAVNPEYKQVLETYCYGEDIKISYLRTDQGKTGLKDGINYDDYACVLIQNPNYFGCIENIDIYEKIRDSKAKLIVCVDPMSLALLKNPAEYGADIAVGDFQPLGISASFGGPHGGFIACKEAYLRQLPGRIVGLTLDKDGREAFTLTLQTREQHIRREKATSNICTNNALMALAATVYMSVLGPAGLKEATGISVHRAHYMARKLAEIPGISVLYDDFLHEFILKTKNISSGEFIGKLAEKDIFIGIDLSKKFENMKNCVLVSVTEMNSPEEIDRAVKMIKSEVKKHSCQPDGIKAIY